MGVAKLTICRWIGDSMKERIIDSPGWPEIEEAIRSLDGDQHNDIYLQPSVDQPETFLCVGGGPAQFIVTGSIENDRFPTLVVGDPTDNHVQLVVGGQTGDYPSNWIVGRREALSAARAFFDHDGFSGGVDWVEV